MVEMMGPGWLMFFTEDVIYQPSGLVRLPPEEKLDEKEREDEILALSLLLSE